MKKLPKNWKEITIEEIATKIQYGYTAKSSHTGEGIRYLRITDIQNDSVDWKNVPSCKIDEDDIDKFLLKINDIVFARTGATVGKSFLLEDLPVKSVFASYLIRLQVVNNLNPKLIKYFFHSSNYWNQISESATGTGQPNVNASKLAKIIFPLPPFPEQKRIVAKLDVLFGHLDRLREQLAGVPELLKQFRQSVLTEAVTGRLTEEWREGKELKNDFSTRPSSGMRETSKVIPTNWAWLPFSSVATVKSNLVEPLDFLDYPLIAPNNIQTKTGKLISKPLVSDIKPKSSKHFFEKGCIVYSKIRPYLSKLILVDFDGLCSADMYPIISDLEIKYLFYYMLSEEFLEYANTSGERTVLPKINQKELSIIPISVPSLVEQKEIVRQVESLFAKVDAIEKRYEQVKTQLDQLPQAILAKAFRGELVEQRDSDGDAQELLDKIKLEKLNVDKKPKSKPKISSKNEVMAKELVDILKINGKMEAIDLWKQSNFSEDIESFYVELKKQVEEKNTIKESKQKGYLELVK